MSTITVELDGQHIDFEITYYSAARPAIPEELEWVAVDPSVQALIDYFDLYIPVERLICEQVERDRADADDYA